MGRSIVVVIILEVIAVAIIFIQLSANILLEGLLEGVFLAALGLVLVGMGLYILDIKMSLGALKLEIRAGDEDLI